MKKVILKSLEAQNFKAIKNFKEEINEGVTTFAGRNGVGKTTLADVYSFVLFDKDSNGNSKVEFKPTDKNGNVISGLVTYAAVTIEIDGKITKLSKELKEKVTKKKGESESKVTGNDLNYFIDDVPTQATVYKSFVNNLVDVTISKYITDPLFFCEKLEWKERRKLLMTMAGEVDDLTFTEMAEIEGKELVIEILKNKEELSNAKAKANAQAKKIKEQIEKIDPAIEEQQRIQLDLSSVDFPEIEKQISLSNEEKRGLQQKTTDFAASNKEAQELATQKQNELFELKNELRDNTEKSANRRHSLISLKDIELMDYNDAFVKPLESKETELKVAISKASEEIEENELDLTKLRADYSELQAREFVFDEKECKCEACGRDYESTDIETRKAELKAVFEKSKASKLTTINDNGKALKETTELLKLDLELFNKQLSENAEKLKEAYKALEKLDTELTELKTSKAETFPILEKQISEFVIPEIPKMDGESEVAEKIKAIDQTIIDLNVQLSKRNDIQKSKDRVKELTAQKLNLNQELANFQRIEIAVETFVRTKVRFYQDKINSMFKVVKFKMFHDNFSDGIEELCEATIDGIPFKNQLNTGHKIIAGMDVISTFQGYFQTIMPIFIDNSEALTERIDTDSQVVFLRADEKYNVLTKI